MKKSGPTALVILDGFGYSTDTTYNAIAQAKMPHLRQLLTTYPWTTLAASGQAVGLLAGMAGNSEVGHLTLGAGRINKQLVVTINEAIRNGTFARNPILQNALHTLVAHNKAVHIMGLLSNAYVHGTIEHMYACIDAAVSAGIKRIYVHPFLDGRDTPPRSAAEFLEQLTHRYIACPEVILGSLQGRWYAMDRNKNWDRTEQSYRLLTQVYETPFADWRQALDYYYTRGITDEFIPPTQLDTHAVVTAGDGVIITNFRADRARQLAVAFADTSFDAFARKQIPLQFCITLADYQEKRLGALPLFEHAIITDTLKERLDAQGLRIFSIAETEKYAHVTYFFDGEREAAFTHETRVLVPSIVARTYAEHPRMSADSITEHVVQSLASDPCDFYLINYANADMVGHSGDIAATITAVECLDEQVGIVYNEFVVQRKGSLFIVGDHGKAELMYDTKTGQSFTAHTTNPVYFIACSDWYKEHGLPKMQGLADVAGVILQQMK